MGIIFTAKKRCRQMQKKILQQTSARNSSGYRYAISKTVSYPEPFWDRLFDSSQVVEVLKNEPKYYKPCGPSTIDEMTKAMVVLSGVNLKWFEDQDPGGKQRNRFSDKWEQPCLTWEAISDEHHFIIKRLHNDSGVYIPTCIYNKSGSISSRQIHDGLNTLDDAKAICELHYLECTGSV